MNDSFPSSRPDPAYPRESFRLTFRFDGDSIELVDQQRLRMIAPPPFGDPPVAGVNNGTWLELLDEKGGRVAVRSLHDPFRRFAEHHSPDGNIERFEREITTGQFEVLIPAARNATTVSLLSNETSPANRSAAATEVARFDLDFSNDQGKETAR